VTLPFEDRGAIFSPCGRYRYRLHRTWDARDRILTCLMLNPSTADAEKNDPTIERCERRARALTFGGLIVVNLFALRSTDPRALATAVRAGEDPVGPENDAHIDVAARQGVVLCAWGRHGMLQRRARVVAERLGERLHVDMFCLGKNADESPVHPLYVPYAQPFVPWP
jgi:hypothetical protein